jgi:ribosomal protein S18 acetylase RimI-like enzyme
LNEVKGADVKIRRLSPADASAYRNLRLEALKLAPEAYSSTFAAENSETLAFFAARIDTSAVFGACANGNLLGIAGFVARQGQKQAHEGVLVGMYVQPGARNLGIGQRLVEAVIEHAKEHVEILQLSVVVENEPGKRLYRKLGFVEYGLEKRALKQAGRYWDEVLMVKSLAPEEAGEL